MTPTCPKHLVPMAESKFGGYYCKQKDGDAFCKEKVKPSPQAATIPTTGSSSDARWAAALGAASQIYRGAGVEMIDDLLALTERLYKSFP